MKRALAALLLLAGALAGAIVHLNLRGEAPLDAPSPPFVPTPALIARGEMLARAGDCAACHTARGGAAYAGGRGVQTPFGTIYSSNLTPDLQTGIGSWTPAHFWRALHHGRSKDGRLLYPAFPYPEYTLVTRDDADAIFAYLQSLPPVDQPNRTHDLAFPYDTQVALAAWRALYFRAGSHRDDPAQSAAWNRGAYLVRGLGHCNACHAPRNRFGATEGGLELGGGLIPMQNWYAPALNAADEAGVADWPEAEIVRLLKTGTSARGSVLGPMAEVVLRSTQHLDDADLQAIAVFLKSLPQRGASRPAAAAPSAESMARGGRLYEEHCASCHGKSGEGATAGDRIAYPPLAGNRAVALDPPANLIRVVANGGFPPATAGNPRPFGMPPFSQVLKDDQIADLLTYIRNSWGHAAGAVAPAELQRYRASRAE